MSRLHYTIATHKSNRAEVSSAGRKPRPAQDTLVQNEYPHFLFFFPFLPSSLSSFLDSSPCGRQVAPKVSDRGQRVLQCIRNLRWFYCIAARSSLRGKSTAGIQMRRKVHKVWEASLGE